MAGRQMALPAGQPAPKQLAPFRAGTRQQIITLDSMSFNAFSQTKTIQLPQTGLLSRLFLLVYGNGTSAAAYTTGSGTPNGSWKTYPFQPFPMISQIRLWTAGLVDFVRSSAFGLYLYQLGTRRAQNVDQDALSTHDSTAIRAKLYKTLSGSLAASTGYDSRFFLEIPLWMDTLAMQGMIELQTYRSRLNLSLTTGTEADMTSESSVSVTPSIQCDVFAEIFSEPDPSQYQQPYLGWVKQVIEDFLPVTGLSDTQYRPITGSQYSRICGIFENNAAGVDVTKFLKTRIRFGQSNTPYDESYYNHVARNYWDLGLTLPDGGFYYDFTRGSGVVGLYDPRDVFNTARLSDFQHSIAMDSSLSLTNAQIRYVNEMISARS